MVPALHRGVVVVVAFGAHAGDQAVRVEQVAMVAGAILTAAIRVHDHAARPLAPKQRHAQRIAYQAGGHPFGHRPADHLARKQVQHDGQVQPAFVRARVGHVADPELVRPLRGEFLLQQVLRHRKRRCRLDHRGQIKQPRDISARPPVVDERSRIGDWELDTMDQGQWRAGPGDADRAALAPAPDPACVAADRRGRESSHHRHAGTH